MVGPLVCCCSQLLPLELPAVVTVEAPEDGGHVAEALVQREPGREGAAAGAGDVDRVRPVQGAHRGLDLLTVPGREDAQLDARVELLDARRVL